MMEHRLTVQGTDEVYLRAKQQMEIAEKLRKEQRTQQIKVPQSERFNYDHKDDYYVVSMSRSL